MAAAASVWSPSSNPSPTREKISKKKPTSTSWVRMPCSSLPTSRGVATTSKPKLTPKIGVEGWDWMPKMMSKKVFTKNLSATSIICNNVWPNKIWWNNNMTVKRRRRRSRTNLKRAEYLVRSLEAVEAPKWRSLLLQIVLPRCPKNLRIMMNILPGCFKPVKCPLLKCLRKSD